MAAGCRDLILPITLFYSASSLIDSKTLEAKYLYFLHLLFLKKISLNTFFYFIYKHLEMKFWILIFLICLHFYFSINQIMLLLLVFLYLIFNIKKLLTFELHLKFPLKFFYPLLSLFSKFFFNLIINFDAHFNLF